MDDIMPFSIQSAMPPENYGEQHIACVLLVDISGSMMNSMNELHQGLDSFRMALQQDEQASGCADVSLIAFNSGVQTIIPFCPASVFSPPQLQAGGGTSMNGAIIEGLRVIEERKALYKSYGISYFRPWMFLLTDGTPTDTNMEGQARQMLQSAITGNKINFFPMGIGNADLQRLRSYAGPNGTVLKADQQNFREAFVWLSNSLSVISNSAGMSQATLPPLPNMITVSIN